MPIWEQKKIYATEVTFKKHENTLELMGTTKVLGTNPISNQVGRLRLWEVKSLTPNPRAVNAFFLFTETVSRWIYQNVSLYAK